MSPYTVVNPALIQQIYMQRVEVIAADSDGRMKKAQNVGRNVVMIDWLS
ncbi:hypothetical protein [Photobacterium aquae]|nr:hypothetical protein [Photobacterium aquae]